MNYTSILGFVLAISVFPFGVAEAGIVPVSLPVPSVAQSAEGPVSGQFQGMVTSVSPDMISINEVELQLNGDTVVTYYGNATTLAVGEMVNYAYATAVDGVRVAVTLDVYPTVPASGSHQISRLNVINDTRLVELFASSLPTVEYYQPYTYITGVQTSIVFDGSYLNYAGYINPVTGRILATEGFLSAQPLGMPLPPEHFDVANEPVVVDVLAPTITLIGESIVDITQGSAYGDQGAVSIDETDGDLTASIITENLVNVDVVGIYSVNYTVSDAGGNIGTASRIVRVLAPVVQEVTGNGVITYIGRAFMEINGGVLAEDHVYYTPTPAGTTFLGGATTFHLGDSVTFTGTLDVMGAVHATSMTVTPRLVIAPTALLAKVGVPMSPAVIVSGGIAPYDIVTTNLPSGVMLGSDGILSGVPTMSGVFTVSVLVTDSMGGTMAGSFTVDVAKADIVVTTVKVSGKGTVEGYDDTLRKITLTNGRVLYVTDATRLKLNYRALGLVGARVEYKGYWNTDGSITVVSYEQK